MSVHGMYATIQNATTSVSIDAVVDCNITGILLVLDQVGPVDGGTAQAELSFLSQNNFASNDTTGVLAGLRCTWELLTSGAATAAREMFLGGLKEPLAAGERIYLHLVATATNIAHARAFIFTDANSNRPSPRRR
jgi:hypothetical protein